MKNRDEVMADAEEEYFGGADVFTSEEFAELLEPSDDPEDNEIEFVDSFGVFHDGEKLTDIKVDPYTFSQYKDQYPYVVWFKR